MDNKDWDSYLQSILGDFKPEGDALWDDFNSKLEDSPMDSSDVPGDEALRNTLSDYKPDQAISGWDKLESSLDKADTEFDQDVADKIKHYQAPYNPNAWALFLKHFSAYKALRLKLIAVKVFEATAVLLLVFTAFQMNQKGSFPLFAQHKTSGIEQNTGTSQQIPVTDPQPAMAANDDGLTADTPQHNTVSESTDEVSSQEKQLASAFNPSIPVNEVTGKQYHLTPNTLEPISISSRTFEFTSDRNTALVGMGSIQAQNASTSTINVDDHVTESLALANIEMAQPAESLIPYPVFVKPADIGHLEFGMLVQTDFNNLKMPQDILYSHKKQFVFPLQGISSVGYGAGFTLGVSHDRWAFESGVIYNSRTFKPGRRVTVGEGSDNSSIEFEAMQMQMISVPLQFRYKLTPNRRFNVYAIAGFGMHVIAQSDIDVHVDYNFNSLPAGENPNDHPALAQTIRESQRLSDKFRHKAPFSTKSYISANLGLGIEYAIAERKTLFLQSTYQYQIPNLRFSNHNGKHLVSTSIQAGLRTPLGF